MLTNVSIRARLTLAFTALFGAIIFSLSVASYALVYSDAYAKLDSQLRVAVDATAMAAEEEFSEYPDRASGERDVQNVLNEMSAAAIPGTQILFCEGERRVAYRSGGENVADLRGLTLREVVNKSNIEGLRVVKRDFHVEKFNTDYQIYSASSTTPAISQLRTLKYALLICVPLGLALAAFAGYTLARRSLAPLLDLARTVDSITSSDLSARVAWRDSEDEIGKLSARFNLLLSRLENAFNVQRHFMADASHELRTPLTVALSAVQVTTRDPQRSMADCDDALQLVEQQMQKLKRIVEDMLFLSHADATPQVQHKEMYFDDAIADAVRAARTLARAKQQTLKVNALAEALCLGDQDLLKQAILILLDNAVKFTPPSGAIEVSFEKRGSFWTCSVTDSGVGIPKEAQPFIFQRFYRAENPSAVKTSGAGLGLAIAKSIVESHGGELTLVTSRADLTIFEISVPVHVPVTPEPPKTQANSFAVRI